MLVGPVVVDLVIVEDHHPRRCRAGELQVRVGPGPGVAPTVIGQRERLAARDRSDVLHRRPPGASGGPIRPGSRPGAGSGRGRPRPCGGRRWGSRAPSPRRRRITSSGTRCGCPERTRGARAALRGEVSAGAEPAEVLPSRIQARGLGVRRVPEVGHGLFDTAPHDPGEPLAAAPLLVRAPSPSAAAPPARIVRRDGTFRGYLRTRDLQRAGAGSIAVKSENSSAQS